MILSKAIHLLHTYTLPSLFKVTFNLSVKDVNVYQNGKSANCTKVNTLPKLLHTTVWNSNFQRLGLPLNVLLSKLLNILLSNIIHGKASLAIKYRSIWKASGGIEDKEF